MDERRSEFMSPAFPSFAGETLKIHSIDSRTMYQTQLLKEKRNNVTGSKVHFLFPKSSRIEEEDSVKRKDRVEYLHLQAVSCSQARHWVRLACQICRAALSS
eukprot:scpid49468/ scgid17126/ 